MKKKTKITIISSVTALAIIAVGFAIMPTFVDSPIEAEIPNKVTSSNISSAPQSSEATSSFVVPEIKPTEPVSTSPPVSSAPTEIKVEGSPTSKPSGTSSTVSKPKDTTPKPTTQVSSTPTAKPTGNGDVYDPLTGTYPKIGDTSTSPRSGAEMTWTGTAWMTSEASGKGGNGQDDLDQAHNEGYTGKDIGADD